MILSWGAPARAGGQQVCLGYEQGCNYAMPSAVVDCPNGEKGCGADGKGAQKELHKIVCDCATGACAAGVPTACYCPENGQPWVACSSCGVNWNDPPQNQSCGSFCFNCAGMTPCGDGVCNGGETHGSCASDCPSSCGDHICDGGETPCSCPGDCGCGTSGQCSCDASYLAQCRTACPAACGNGKCDPDETHDTCAADCKVGCGNGTCDPGEDCATCPADCGVCCGNNVCDHGETCTTCPGDCGECACNESSDGPGCACSPEEGDATCCQSRHGKPVHALRGTLTVGPVEDLRLTGAFDDDIVVRRNYASLRPHPPGLAQIDPRRRAFLGAGWAHNLQPTLIDAKSRDRTVVMKAFIREDGESYLFQEVSSGNAVSYEDHTGRGWRLVHSSSGDVRCTAAATTARYKGRGR
ncbi:MAG TPA: hypothetical protein VGQ83_02670 [Polyangia bacterium]